LLACSISIRRRARACGPRRITTGLTLNSQYTFSRSVGNTAGSNEARTAAVPDNFEADRGYNNFDVRHTFNISALYKLPFGKGSSHEFGSVGNALLGDWEVGGIVNARSGLPIEVGIVRPDVVMQCAQATCPVTVNGVATTVPQGFVANLPSGALPIGFVGVINTPGGGASRNIRRPNFIPGVNPYLNNDRNLINPAAFSIPGPGQFGDVPRNALRGPGFQQRVLCGRPALGRFGIELGLGSRSRVRCSRLRAFADHDRTRVPLARWAGAMDRLSGNVETCPA